MKERNKTNEKTVTELICSLKVGETFTRPYHLIDSTRNLIDTVKRKPDHSKKVFSCFGSTDKKTCIVTRRPEFNIPDEIQIFLADVYAKGTDELGIKAAELSNKYCI